jgi:tetratricopeptide (TPR) repeat protein
MLLRPLRSRRNQSQADAAYAEAQIGLLSQGSFCSSGRNGWIQDEHQAIMLEQLAIAEAATADAAEYEASADAHYAEAADWLAQAEAAYDEAVACEATQAEMQDLMDEFLAIADEANVEADEAYSLAEEYLADAEEWYNLGVEWEDLGDEAYDLGDYELADECYEEAQTCYANSIDCSDQAEYYTQLGDEAEQMAYDAMAEYECSRGNLS